MGVSIIVGCVIGVVLGIFAPTIPYGYSKYLAVAIIAAFDSVIGAVSANCQNKFNMKIFVSGFFTNAVIAIFLTMLGESLDVDIFLAAIFVFVFRIFTNLSTIRRFIIEEIDKKKYKKSSFKESKVNGQIEIK